MPVPSQPSPGLFNASGLATRLRASPLLSIGPSAPVPSLRRGALVAVPIGLALAFELGFNAPTKGAIATGALINGFPGLDAPAKPRAAWQGATAPIIGVVAALGVLSSQTVPTAVLALGLLGAAAGYCFAVSLRLAIAGLSVTLAMMIAQGLLLPASEAGPALLYGTLGGLGQMLWSLLVWVVVDRAADQPESAWNTRRAIAALRSNFSLDSPVARHGLRFGAALAAGVALYRLLGMREHGFWIPLTVLFVMRPERDETMRRVVLRGLGTVLGLVVATAIAEAFGGDELVVGVVLTLAAALSFGLLTVQYALFTAAITTYVVVLSVTIGEPAFEAAGQRALGTAIGLLVCWLAFVLWPGRGEGGGGRHSRVAAPAPEAVAR
jgi:hypothetical protein